MNSNVNFEAIESDCLRGIKFVIPFFYKKSKKKQEERLSIKTKDGSLYTLDTLDEAIGDIDCSKEYIREANAIFIKVANSTTFEPFEKLIDILSEEEKAVIYQFILNNMAFKYGTGMNDR